MTDPRATVTGIHTIGVPVTDQDAATAFYRDVLGFEVRADVNIDELGSRWIELAPAGSPVTVALVRTDGNDPAGREVGIRFTTPDAAALHARFSAEGVDVDELLTWPGVPPMFVFRDRDGNGLEIVEAS